VEMLLPGRVDL